MKLSMEQQLEQKQEMVMTPRLRMAIEILQLNTQQLQQLIQNKYLENPFLEKEDENLQERINEHKNTGSSYSSSKVNSGEREKFKKFMHYKPQLYEYLTLQLREVLEEKNLEIGRAIIANLEDTGLLKIDNAELAKELDCSFERIEKVRNKIMNLDPPGIAARTSREAMRTQLKQIEGDSLADLILQENYQNLADLTLNQLCQELKTNKDRTLKALAQIKQLNPHPISGFTEEREKAGYIEPDIILKKVEGKYVVELNQGASPALTINKKYYQMMQEDQSEETAEYLRKKFSSALWLIKAVERRKMTLTKITKIIADIQTEFLQKGIEYLQPLTMQEIADRADVHESTVSRAVRDKYIQTERGLFQLKFFFSEGVNGKSSTAIKSIITSYIEEEDETLSDRELAEKMEREHEIKMSRRTIAKYRNSLGIPSSFKRKKWYNQI